MYMLDVGTPPTGVSKLLVAAWECEVIELRFWICIKIYIDRER
jgi:hypothetical protein